MKENTKLFSVFIGVGLLFILGISLLLSQKDQDELINSFEDCVKAGYPVMESFPRQCRISDGTLFVEKVAVPPAVPTTTVPTSTQATTTTNPVANLIQVLTPLPNTLVSSPLTATGQARGNWYFEASFPVELKDSNGAQLALTPATAIGNWMTVNWVPFSVTLTFATPTTATGTLIFHKDNPSGEPINDAQYSMEVQF